MNAREELRRCLEKIFKETGFVVDSVSADWCFVKDAEQVTVAAQPIKIKIWARG